MQELSHRIFVFFLFIAALSAAIAIWLRNNDYYLSSLEERPFHPRYDTLKPSGTESHGYGVVGTAMIIVGVATYSTRKRIKTLANAGSIKYFLEFHIFLCLLGPILVLYHTTFKFGGLVAVAFWSMTAVVLSGFVGRYLYQHIPKNIQGNELSMKELEGESKRLSDLLQAEYRLPADVLASIDSIGLHQADVVHLGFLKLLSYMIQGDFSRVQRMQRVRAILRQYSIDTHSSKGILRIANERIILRQRIVLLEKIRQLFHYWHVVHLPFSLVMFAILAIHIGVAIAFGYTWIW
ncbi:MAG: hypothetical protein WBW71_07295 [Bacteroidota bacterium]